MTRKQKVLTRRAFSSGVGVSALMTPSILRAQEQGSIRRNTSSFRTHAWEDHFDRLGIGIIISDTTSRVLQQWKANVEIRR